MILYLLFFLGDQKSLDNTSIPPCFGLVLFVIRDSNSFNGSDAILVSKATTPFHSRTSRPTDGDGSGRDLNRIGEWGLGLGEL
jgi:hypothetical protein